VGFVFFDTETTGLRQGFDQIVHFAAIQTDFELNETGRFELRSRLQPRVVPHPSALLANGLPIARLMDPDLPSHFEMVCQIRKWLLSWSPAIFAGFNSIRFDEEMLRHSLFQSLFPAFLTSNHGNGRADVLSLAMAAAAQTPACLNVPINDGKPSFQLGLIAAANGLFHERSHDAMSDVAVTVDLCRMVRDRSEECWQRFVRFSKKATVAEFVEAEDAFVLTEFFGGQAYHTTVTVIGSEPDNRNGRFCLDLAFDPNRFRQMTNDDLRAEVARKASPVRRLRVNAAPTLTALYDAPEVIIAGQDVGVLEARGQDIRQDPDLRARIIAAYTAGWSPAEASPHPEARLYSDGFPGPDDVSRMIAFHDATWSQRIELVSGFDDPRLRAFGARLVHAERRSALSNEGRYNADHELATYLLQGQGGPLTLREALKETLGLLAEANSESGGLLADYRDYLEGRIAKVIEFRQAEAPT